MRKQKLMIVILFIILICSYFLSHTENQKVVCSLLHEKSTIDITASYDNDQVVKSLEVRYMQKFSKKSLSNMSEDEIVETLKTIFSQNGNENVDVQVTYDGKKREGEVYLKIDMDHLTQEELDEFNLTSDINKNDFIKMIENREFDCEVTK